MADVIALELETGAMTLSELLHDALDIFEGIPEDEVAAALEVLGLPLVLEFLVALEHGVEAKVHRAHIERGHLRAGAQRGGEPLLQSHAMAAARRDIDHGLAALLDAGQKFHEHLGIGCGPAVL